jgi:hypothetical protein
MAPCVLLVCVFAGCGGSATPAHHGAAQQRAALPAAPISAGTLGLTGRIVITNGWQGRVTGQRLRVAAGRYADNGEGVALVSDAGNVEREVRAPRGEGALRFLRRDGPALELRSHRGHRFSLNLRTLELERKDGAQRCPRGALRGPRPSIRMRYSHEGLRPLPAPKSDAFAALLAILAGAQGRVMAIEAAPATTAPCGLADRSLVAHVAVATPRPIVSVYRRVVFVSRFQRGWRAWRVSG